MARRNNTEKTKNLVVFLFLVVALPVTLFLVLQQTQWFNRAAGPAEQGLTNLNSASEIVTTNNPDGTMGPDTWYGNASNSVPSYLKGSLFFKVTDPMPDNPGSQGQANRPTESFRKPSDVGAGNQGTNSAQQNNGPETLTALNLTIDKVEVHMAYQGNPQNNQGGDASSAAGANSGKAVDHWETLNITTPITVDLVSLASTNDSAPLGITQLAAGRYTEVRLYVSEATATLADGTQVTLTIPGTDKIVRVVRTFVITAGQQTVLTMDFDAQHSVVKAGENYLLRPVVARLIQE